MNKIKLNLGCGVRLRSGYINVDNYFDMKQLKSEDKLFNNVIIEDDAEFIQANILNLPFDNDYVDYILFIDVIEHLKIREVIPGLQEIYRVMKPNATMTLMTIDYVGLCRDFLDLDKQFHKDKKLYLDAYAEIAMAIYGNQIGKHDGEHHKVPFNDIFLSYCLNEAGFNKFEIIKVPYGCKNPEGLDGLSDIPGVNKYDMIIAKVTK